MRIINIVSGIAPIYTGLWQAAMSTAVYFRAAGIDSEIWSPDADDLETPAYLRDYTIRPIAKGFEPDIEVLIQKANLNPAEDLIVTHGCWYEPTRLGFAFKKLGFRWIAMPHSMLNEWALQQKWLKKKLYYNFFEKKALSHADILRGVSTIETARIKSLFPKKEVVFIPNGFKTDNCLSFESKPIDIMHFIFLARLHHTKGVLPLVQGWEQSNLNNNSRFSLQIIGPDEGELVKMQPYIQQSNNILYHGAIFDAEKKAKILRGGHFYILPSFCEGFPTSVIEAMFYGNIPVITRECNFHDVFDKNLGFEITSQVDNIKTKLNELSKLDISQLHNRFAASSDIVKEEYSLDKIAEMQLALFKRVLQS